ncbi:MAG: hypothetical protein ACKV2V_21180 [Blastocatellia bacterium]
MHHTLPLSAASSTALAACQPGRQLLLVGENAPAVSTELMTSMACDDRLVQFVCGDNVFNPYAVARMVKARGCQPEPVLRRIRVARPFTPWQLEELVFSLRPDDSPRVTFISGIAGSLMDDDLSRNEAARIFYRILWRIAALSKAGMTILLSQGRFTSNPARAYLLNDLRRAAAVVLQLDGAGFTVEQQTRTWLPHFPKEDLWGEPFLPSAPR